MQVSTAATHSWERTWNTTVLRPPPETKKVLNDQPTQLFYSLLVESPTKVSKSGNEGVLQKLHFCPFLVDFHSARLFFACYGFFCVFCAVFCVGVGWGMSMGQFWVFAFWAFLHFGPFWALFGHFFGFSGHLGILKVLVSYWETRVIILVVGTVYGGFWVGLGGSRGVWGAPGGSRGVYFTPLGHFLPLWKCVRH